MGRDKDFVVGSLDCTTLKVGSNTLDGTEFATLDGITAGTVAASKAVIVDANKDIGDFRNLDVTNLDAGASGTAGSVDIFASTASKGKFILSCADQDGDTAVTLKPAAMAQATVVSIPDPGAATANVLLTSQANDGTVVTSTAAELNILDGVTATATEINQHCDVSGRIVTIADATNTLTLGAAHANRIAYVLDATLATTLPEATGTGNVYTVVQGIAATSSTFVTADTDNCHFVGLITGGDTDADSAYTWAASGAVDTITFNGAATGGKVGDWVRFTDVATDVWLLEGNIKQSGGSEATPLSNA